MSFQAAAAKAARDRRYTLYGLEPTFAQELGARLTRGSNHHAVQLFRIRRPVHAKVQRTPRGLRTLVNVIGGDGLLADTDVRLFRNDHDVKHWLIEEAGRRGFSTFAVEFVE
jgi:hypothetical protein